MQAHYDQIGTVALPDGTDIPIFEMHNQKEFAQPNRNFVNDIANFLTCHETGNRKEYADARANSRWQVRRDSSCKYSWHETIDAHSIYQTLPPWRQGWHCTDGWNGIGNTQSIGLEHCQNDIAALPRVYAIGILRARQLRAMGHGLKGTRQHADWYAKNCPEFLRGGKVPGLDWQTYVEAVETTDEARVTEIVCKLLGIEPPQKVAPIPEIAPDVLALPLGSPAREKVIAARKLLFEALAETP